MKISLGTSRKYRHNVFNQPVKRFMNNFFRALIAGYGAKKLGGGCFGTIIVFIIIWVALGQCSWTKSENVVPENRDRAIRTAHYVDSDITRFVDLKEADLRDATLIFDIQEEAELRVD
jgi:hypothetical protein